MTGRPPKLDGRKAGEGARLITMESVQLSEDVTPENMPANALQAWNQMTKSLVGSRLVSHGDLLALEAASRAWGRWKDMEEQIAKLSAAGNLLSGEMTKTPNGHVQMSALRIAANQALKDYISIAREFGLTPVSRVKTSGLAQGDLFGND